MNDPNGLVLFDGEYHLFYQYYPDGTKWGPMHWGHAVSADLLSWSDLPIALYPDAGGTIFSGSAIVDASDSSGFFGGRPGLVAFYTRARKAVDSDHYAQDQCLAYSSDRGRTWIKYEGNPIVPNPGLPDFRDPKVFYHTGTKRWVMVFSGGDRVFFYGSENLRDWKLLSELPAADPRGPLGPASCSGSCVWECPDLMRFPGAGKGGTELWLLKVSVSSGNPSGGSGEFCVFGDFDGERFAPLEGSPWFWLDHGQDGYACQSWHLPGSDRVVLIAWMSNVSYANEVPAGEDWRGIMSLPRELSVELRGDKLVLAQRLVPELERYAKPERVLFEGLLSRRVEVEFLSGPAELSLDAGALGGFSLELVSASGDALAVRIETRLGGESELVVDRSRVGLPFHPASTAVQRIPLGIEGIGDGLALFLDGPVLELFAASGARVASDFVFPTSPFTRVALEPLGEAGEVRLAARSFVPVMTRPRP